MREVAGRQCGYVVSSKVYIIRSFGNIIWKICDSSTKSAEFVVTLMYVVWLYLGGF